MSNALKRLSRISLRDTFFILRSRSGLIAEVLFIRHFSALKRLLIALELVVIVVQVARVWYATVEISSAAHTVQLQADALDEAIAIMEQRRAELPETVVGNRREYFVAPR